MSLYPYTETISYEGAEIEVYYDPTDGSLEGIARLNGVEVWGRFSLISFDEGGVFEAISDEEMTTVLNDELTEYWDKMQEDGS